MIAQNLAVYVRDVLSLMLYHFLWIQIMMSLPDQFVMRNRCHVEKAVVFVNFMGLLDVVRQMLLGREEMVTPRTAWMHTKM